MTTRRKFGMGIAAMLAAQRAPAALIRSLVAGRQTGIGGKRLSAKDYVQDGLVAMWDGIENAGWGVHDANATTWKNLVGNSDYDFAVNQNLGGWDGNSFLTTKDHTVALGKSCAYCDNAIPMAQERTVELTFKIDATNLMPGSRNRLFAFGGTYPMYGYNMRTVALFWNTYESRYGWMFGWAGINRYGSPTSAQPPNGYHAFSTIYPSNNGPSNAHPTAVYKDGAAIQTSWDSNGDASGTNMFVGGYTDNDGFDGHVYCMRIYSRALAADEIAANNAVDKKRFNIT